MAGLDPAIHVFNVLVVRTINRSESYLAGSSPAMMNGTKGSMFRFERRDFGFQSFDAGFESPVTSFDITYRPLARA